MSDAEQAYAKAERMIAEAKATGATMLSLNRTETHALEGLPPEIAELTELEVLDLAGTQVSDLGALSGLTSLTDLRLTGTQVSDLGALSGLTSLTKLWLGGTQVSDLGALSGLTSLTELVLDGAQVSDVGALLGLTSLIGLGLEGTQVSDVGALSGLTSLTTLWLSGTQVSDLRPLRGLQQLVKAPYFDGLTFKDCAAARADAEIARIAEIEDASERARALFAYLEDWVPPGEVHRTLSTVADAGSDLAGAYRGIARGSTSRAAPKTDIGPRGVSAQVAQISTRAIKSVLRNNYPDLQKRSAYLVSLIQQQRAAHALIPRPNDPEPLEAYEAEEEFLKTMEAGLVSLHEDLPEQPVGDISEADAQTLKHRLVDAARLADQAIRYLDTDRGTYGGLYKIGLIASIGSVLALIPGVGFVAGAALPTAILGAQTVRLEVSRAKGLGQTNQ